LQKEGTVAFSNRRSSTTTLSYLSFRAQRGIRSAPRSLPDSQGRTYRYFPLGLLPRLGHALTSFSPKIDLPFLRVPIDLL
jgi:hypothetical protein